jgi:hypothetical protein
MIERQLRPWIVPKNIIKEFCAEAFSREGHYYVWDILKYDKDNFLVITNGFYPYLSDRLKRLIEEHNGTSNMA